MLKFYADSAGQCWIYNIWRLRVSSCFYGLTHEV